MMVASFIACGFVRYDDLLKFGRSPLLLTAFAFSFHGSRDAFGTGIAALSWFLLATLTAEAKLPRVRASPSCAYSHLFRIAFSHILPVYRVRYLTLYTVFPGNLARPFRR